MVYVFLTDFISVTDEVRKLARKVVQGDWTDPEIQPWQYRRYSQIRTYTDKDVWTPSDREFGSLQLIETKLAASDIIEHYGDINTTAVWQAMREEAMTELIATVDNLETTTGDASGSILQTEYKSWNLNTELRPPNRLRNIGGTEGKGSRPLNWEPDF
jgi:hypothetical protein